MYYPDELRQEILSRCDIVSIISQFITLKKKGSNYMCCCPFHNEKTPSFSVSPTKQMYYCFGCHTGGNVITFLQKYDNMSYPEALEYLAPIAGVTLPERDNSIEARAASNKKFRLYELNKNAANYFYKVLWDENRGKSGMAYLKKRELTDETIKHFALGYAPMDGGEVIRYLKSLGFTDQEMLDSGLASYSEKRGVTCKFWNRVMFPILDDKGKVVGFGGRVMGEGEPKYLNSMESDIFNKRRNLYGFYFARSSRKNRFILCEGYMDVISLHQAGFTEAVASLGTAFTEEHARILKRYSPDVYLTYDSDNAGTKAAMRAIEIMRRFQVTGRVINMKPYKDPDEFIKGVGAEEFEKRMEQAEDSFLFQVHTEEKSHDTNDYSDKTKFHHKIAEFLAQMEDPLERDNYLEAVAREYKIDKDHLKEAVKKQAMLMADRQQREEVRSTDKKAPSKEARTLINEQMLLTYLVDEPSLYPQVEPYLSALDFSTEIYRDVAGIVLEELRNGRVPNPAQIISNYEDEEDQSKVSSLFTAQVRDVENKEDKQKAIADLLYQVKKNSYERSTEDDSPEDMKELIRRKKELETLKKIRIILP